MLHDFKLLNKLQRDKNYFKTLLFLKAQKQEIINFIKDLLTNKKLKRDYKIMLKREHTDKFNKNIQQRFKLSLLINQFKQAKKFIKLTRKNKQMKKYKRYRFKHRVAREVRRIRYLSIKRRIPTTNA